MVSKRFETIDIGGSLHLLQNFEGEVKSRLERKQGKNEKAQQKAARRAAKWAKEVDGG